MFRDRFADMFDLVPDEVESSSRLVEDLGLDSVDFFELLCALEEAADRSIDPGLMESLETVEELRQWLVHFLECTPGPE